MMRQPPSRDASTLSQLQQQQAQQQQQQQQQQYQQQRGNSDHGQGGQQNQAYDPSKFTDQGRSTPEGRSQSRAGDLTQES